MSTLHAALLAGLLAVLALTAGTGVAAADPGSDPIPSQEQVDAAKEDVADKAAAVGSIKAQLLLANQRLEEAATRAEQAAEAYNGAMWRLDKATAALKRARAEAAEARRTVAAQRDAIGALAARTYRQGAVELTALNAVFSADGPEAMLGQYAAYQGATSSMQADWQRYAASDALARVFERKAAQAKAKRTRVAEQAEAAQRRAAGAARAAQSAAARIAEEKDQLIRQLADAQNISVELARERQTALEEQARQRAAEAARQEAIAKAKAEAAARAEAEAAAKKAAAEQAAEERREAKRAAEQREREREKRPDRSDPAPDPAPRPQPDRDPEPAPPPPPPPPPPAPSPSGGAQQAIAFARAQVGEPYRWAAAGPNAWDCSGLTMAAWGSAGLSLPHYSVGQYYAGTPISAGELRPGDLVFWSSSRSPGGIHHVALYIGGGQIVHAPRTGRPVAVESMYYWIPPTHFARP